MTDNKIVHLSEVKGTSDISVANMLRLAADEIDSGERVANKALVLFLEDDNPEEEHIYAVGYRNAGMNMTQCISLMRVMEKVFFGVMGF
ncbi:MAG: hypothetical protein KAV87_46395 [Desulfobacteraceae bacterium]|nr:hypothetical protein [Desulfobacteraceae bacterium]